MIVKVVIKEGTLFTKQRPLECYRQTDCEGCWISKIDHKKEDCWENPNNKNLEKPKIQSQIKTKKKKQILHLLQNESSYWTLLH